MFKTKDLRSRIEANSIPEPNTGCWLWTSALNPHGYSRMHVGGRKSGKWRSAYRVAYEVFRGPIPEGRHLDHLCRQPSCVNPQHLEPVVAAVNVQRGKLAKHGDVVRKIRMLHLCAMKQADIVKVVGIPQPTVSHIILRDTWKNVA